MYSPSSQPTPGSASRGRWVVAVLAALVFVLVGIVVGMILARSDSAPLPATGHQAQPQESSGQVQLADTYTGSSQNNTAVQIGLDGKANLTLRFTDKSPQSLRGDITVNGRDVGGTGRVEGTLVGNRISLTVYPTDGVPSYQLIGTVAADGTMTGALSVPGSAYVPAQSGSWKLHPQR